MSLCQVPGTYQGNPNKVPGCMLAAGRLGALTRPWFPVPPVTARSLSESRTARPLGREHCVHVGRSDECAFGGVHGLSGGYRDSTPCRKSARVRFTSPPEPKFFGTRILSVIFELKVFSNDANQKATDANWTNFATAEVIILRNHAEVGPSTSHTPLRMFRGPLPRTLRSLRCRVPSFLPCSDPRSRPTWPWP